MQCAVATGGGPPLPGVLTSIMQQLGTGVRCWVARLMWPGQPNCMPRRACPSPTSAQDALLRMDAAALSVEQLAVLSRAVPDDQERKDIELYLAGKHPKYK